MDIRNITEMMTWLGFYSTVFFAYYYYLRFRNKERVLLIERNVDLSEIYKKPERHFPWFMVGYTLFGIGLGAVISFAILYYMISQSQKVHEQIIVMVFLSASVLFGALGIIIGHSIEQKKKKLRG